MSDKVCNARLSYRHEYTPELFIFGVEPSGWELPTYEAGQYAELAIPEPFPTEPGKKMVRRQYSIASSPAMHGALEFFIVKVEGGELTPKLSSLPIGGELWVNPKLKGKFTLSEIPTGKDLIMVSTGTGIAPFVSMLRQYRKTERWNRFVMINCVRHAAELGYRTELEQVAKTDSSFRYVPLTTREPENSDWHGIRGRVQSVLQPESFESICGFKLAPDNAHVLLCGNPAMIDSVIPDLESRGFKQHSKKDPGNIHFERFW